MASGTQEGLFRRAERKAERDPRGSGLAREEAFSGGIFIG